MRKVAKWTLIGVGIVCVAVLVLIAIVLGPYAVRVERLRPDASAAYHADFYMYVSPAARRAAAAGDRITVLVQPNNSGTNSDDPKVHRRDAWWTGFGRHGLADDLGVVLVVPAFVRPAEDWRIYTHALDRDVLTTARADLGRLDLQLIAMVDRARARLAQEGVQTDGRFLIQGYSASGMFANRFAILHPDRVKAVAAGSPGGWPVAPYPEWQGVTLPYPAGVADLEALTGEPFDSAAWASVPQLVVMGSLDDNDSLFGADPLSRWPAAESLYRAVSPNARFVLVEGVGHDRRALQGHTTDFFRAVLASGDR
jgi:pimeloyl-ACP methyl ester carboxylesterase